MAWQTPKTTWGQAGQTVPGVDDFNRIEGNIDILGKYDRAPGYGTATGTNTKAITLSPAPSSYYEGLCFAFKNETQNTGAVTINVNGMGAKAIKKPNGNDLPAGFLKAGSIYTVRYNGTNFILQGSDSTGNATPEHVLAGKTFSNDAGTELTGTMPNNGSQSATLTITGSGKPTKTIPAGYTTGGTITAQVDPSLASVIKNAVTVGGVQGKYKGEYLVDDIVNISYIGTFAGIDNDYIYITDDSRGIENRIRRYNHVGALISAASLSLGSGSVRGTYNREGAIFTARNSNDARIYNHDGTLLYNVKLLANFIDNYTPMAGYVNGKIAYPTATSIRLETIGGTLLSTYNQYGDKCYMFSNFKESIVVFEYQDDQHTTCYIPRNGNSIISSGLVTEELLGHLQKFFL